MREKNCAHTKNACHRRRKKSGRDGEREKKAARVICVDGTHRARSPYYPIFECAECAKEPEHSINCAAQCETRFRAAARHLGSCSQFVSKRLFDGGVGGARFAAQVLYFSFPNAGDGNFRRFSDTAKRAPYRRFEE